MNFNMKNTDKKLVAVSVQHVYSLWKALLPDRC